MRRRGLHPKSFNLLYRAVSRTWPGRTLLGFLQKEFIARNLSLSLLLEPLDGFEWLSKNRYPLEFSAASPIWLQVISPFCRLGFCLCCRICIGCSVCCRGTGGGKGIG